LELPQEEAREPASSVSELWDIVQKLWEEIPREECQKLIESMSSRLATMVKAKGAIVNTKLLLFVFKNRWQQNLSNE
jgi:hypothetical protein